MHGPAIAIRHASPGIDYKFHFIPKINLSEKTNIILLIFGRCQGYNLRSHTHIYEYNLYRITDVIRWQWTAIDGQQISVISSLLSNCLGRLKAAWFFNATIVMLMHVNDTSIMVCVVCVCI